MTFRRLLISWLMLVQAAILTIVAVCVYLVVYTKVDEATLSGLRWQVLSSWRVQSGTGDRRMGDEHMPRATPTLG